MNHRYENLSDQQKINLFLDWCNALTGGNQTQFAELLQINKSTITFWKKKRQVPGINLFSRLQNILNLSPEQILAGPNASQPHPINTGIPQAHKLGVTVPLPDKLAARINAIAARLGLTRDQIVTAACWRLVGLDPHAQQREIAEALRALAD